MIKNSNKMKQDLQIKLHKIFKKDTLFNLIECHKLKINNYKYSKNIIISKLNIIISVNINLKRIEIIELKTDYIYNIKLAIQIKNDLYIYYPILKDNKRNLKEIAKKIIKDVKKKLKKNKLIIKKIYMNKKIE